MPIKRPVLSIWLGTIFPSYVCLARTTSCGLLLQFTLVLALGEWLILPQSLL